MFEHIDYLAAGNEKQILAYKAIKQLGIMESLSEYTPILCGTIPIGVDIAGSDLDIIMMVADFERFLGKAEWLYGNKENFRMKSTLIREIPVVKVNFIFKGFEFELFGQPKPVKEQYAYLHMMVEH